MIRIVTIDGPSGVGKGSVSLLLAHELQWHFLDSGALYRVLALASVQQGISVLDRIRLSDLAITMAVHFGVTATEPTVWLDGCEVTMAIRLPECGQLASQIAAYPEVRQGLLQRQRAFAQKPGLVADGRDMGTVVFPMAEAKFFLQATAAARAERRYKQLKDKGIDVNLPDLLADIEERDRRDSERSLSPLRPASDALIIDTTVLTLPQVFALVLKHTKARLAK